MNRFLAWIIGNTIAALLGAIFVFGQSRPLESALEVSNTKTVTLVFNAAICKDGVDCGKTELGARTVDGVGNVLLVKAAGPQVDNTTLTVITEDGSIHSFRVRYMESPHSLLIDLRTTPTPSPATTPVLFDHGRLTGQEVITTSQLLTKYPPFLSRPKASSPGAMKMAYAGSYLKDGVIFFQFTIRNASRIPYDLDFTRFYIRDRSRSKRSSRMEKEVIPLTTSFAFPGSICADTQTLVVAFEKFTIASRKHFVAEIYERNGDRHLKMNIRGKDILRSRPSPY